MYASEINRQLAGLCIERALAEAEGLADTAAYMRDLDSEIAALRTAFVTTAVTEIATSRAELSGANFG